MDTSQLKISGFKPKLNLELYRCWQKRFQRHLKWMQVKVSGIEKISKNGPGLLAPNHTNWKDIPLLGGVIQRPVSFAADIRLFDEKLCYNFLFQFFATKVKNPSLQNAAHRLSDFISNFIVPRVSQVGSFPAKMDVNNFCLIDTAKMILHKDKLVCVFPEGTLGSPKKMHRFKLGTAKILFDYYKDFKESIPAYPIGIIGTNESYRPGMKLGFHVGSPMYIEDFIQSNERDTLVNFINELREAVQYLLRTNGKMKY
ncbi:1-acyl-sn-glycerol-3-phosphate acyltransferase [candidate division KSB1 bacterium]|nr:1-acyl-sn-glycerol-3-phosphate acyltransferase [candidate division KSB1 bacterium]